VHSEAQGYSGVFHAGEGEGKKFFFRGTHNFGKGEKIRWGVLASSEERRRPVQRFRAFSLEKNALLAPRGV